jgi:hypothetical protein
MSGCSRVFIWWRASLQPEFLGIAVKDELLTGDKGDGEDRPLAFEPLSRDTLQQGMTFENFVPDRRERPAAFHGFRASLRQFNCAVLEHACNLQRGRRRRFELGQCIPQVGDIFSKNSWGAAIIDRWRE